MRKRLFSLTTTAVISVTLGVSLLAAFPVTSATAESNAVFCDNNGYGNCAGPNGSKNYHYWTASPYPGGDRFAWVKIKGKPGTKDSVVELRDTTTSANACMTFEPKVFLFAAAICKKKATQEFTLGASNKDGANRYTVKYGNGKYGCLYGFKKKRISTGTCSGKGAWWVLESIYT